jgi:hypothetical protein
MTINSSTRIAGPYTGNGSTTAFPFSFKVFTTADVTVVRTNLSGVESTLTLGTDYTVSLNANQNSNPGGTVTMLTAPASGFLITLTSSLGYTQTLDLTNQGGFYPSVINDALDRATIQIQQLNEQVGRAAKVNISSGTDTTSLVNNINTLANNLTTVQAVNANQTNINTVSSNSSNINTVAGNSANITTVAGVSGNVTTVASNISSVNTNATNITAIQNAATNAATASTQAAAASTSATNAASSATAAASSATSAATSATSASTASSNASASQSAAAASATNAATSATAATNQATIASTQASNAATSASSSAASQTAAATSQTNAAASATAAGNAQTAAEAARDATLTAYDNFDDRYLGTKTSDPTVDNDGNPLVAGSLYFNSGSGTMKVYTGSAWVAAYVSGSGYLASANNLSDVVSASSARTNLGLVTVASSGSATDLDSGTLPTGRLSGSYTGVTGVGTLTTGSIPTTLITGALPIANGGNGLTTAPTNGQIDIGNGTGFTRSALTAGTGLSVTNGAGSITLANTGVTSAVAGTGVSVSGATGAVTLSIGQAVATSSNVQFNSLGVGTAGSATAGEIRATNNITAYYTSDIKFKENIQPIKYAAGIIRSIGADYFDWTDEYIAEHGGEDGYFIQKSDFGVIAQKVQKVFPKAVRIKPDGTLAVDYEKLGVLAFPAIAEILERLEQVEIKLER